MFWGLTLKANRRYSQTLKKAFHLSNAALDIPSCTDNELIQVIISHDGHDYVLCNLRKNKVEQVTLDLTFKEGEEIAFTSQGNGNVHLTGYLLLDDDFDELEEESDMEELVQNKSVKKEANPVKKKALQVDKKNKSAENEEDEDEDDDEDSEVDDSSNFGEQDDDDGEEDDDDEDEEDEDEDDDESDDEVQQPKAKQIKLDKVQQNGLENGQVSAKEGPKKEKKKKDKQKQQQNQQQQQQKPQQQNQQKQDKSPKGSEKTLQGGVKIEDIQVGNGPEAKPGKKVQVYYEGRLKQNNKVFDSTKQGKGFKFGLGKGEVIKGWDIGVSGMKVGGKRRITCPPHMAYGAKGHPPVIPPNSTLVFEIELKGVN